MHPLLRRGKKDGQYDDTNFAVLNALDTVLSDAEKETIKSKIQSSLKTATGEYLDRWGGWFGLPRFVDKGENDEEYRARIVAYTLLKRGTIQSIIDAIKWYLEDENANVGIYEPFRDIFFTDKSTLDGPHHLMGYYYRFAIIDISIDRPFPPEILDIIQAFKPAGVLFYVGYDSGLNVNAPEIISPFAHSTVFTGLDIERWTGLDFQVRGNMNMGDTKKSLLMSNIFITDKSKLNSADFLIGIGTSAEDTDNINLLGPATGELKIEDTTTRAQAISLLDTVYAPGGVQAVDGTSQTISVGSGRNLIPNTSFIDDKVPPRGSVGNPNPVFVTEDGYRCQYWKNTDNVSNCGWYIRKNNFLVSPQVGDKFTISFMAKGKGNINTYFMESANITKGDNGSLSSTWKKFVIQGTHRATDGALIFYLTNAVSGSEIYLRNIKVEEGIIDNPVYSPAPEDPEYATWFNTYAIFNLRDTLITGYSQPYKSLYNTTPTVVDKVRYSDFTKEPSVTLVLSSLAPVKTPTGLTVKIKDFTEGSWNVLQSGVQLTVATGKVSLNVPLGSLRDYMNKEGLVVIALYYQTSIQVPVNLDYIGLNFINRTVQGKDMVLTLQGNNDTITSQV